jgi:hypothetical protein
VTRRRKPEPRGSWLVVNSGRGPGCLRRCHRHMSLVFRGNPDGDASIATSPASKPGKFTATRIALSPHRVPDQDYLLAPMGPRLGDSRLVVVHDGIMLTDD